MNKIQEQPILIVFVVFLSTPIHTSITGWARHNQAENTTRTAPLFEYEPK